MNLRKLDKAKVFSGEGSTLTHPRKRLSAMQPHSTKRPAFTFARTIHSVAFHLLQSGPDIFHPDRSSNRRVCFRSSALCTISKPIQTQITQRTDEKEGEGGIVITKVCMKCSKLLLAEEGIKINDASIPIRCGKLRARRMPLRTGVESVTVFVVTLGLRSIRLEIPMRGRVNFLFGHTLPRRT